MAIDAALVLTLVLFFMQIAAGVAPMKYPDKAWIADIVWWLSLFGALASLGWWLHVTKLMPEDFALPTKPGFWWAVLFFAMAAAVFALSRIAAPSNAALRAAEIPAKSNGTSRVASRPWHAELVSKALPKLDEPALSWLRNAPMGSRPSSEEVALELNSVGLIDRDFTGWTGIKPELRETVARLLPSALTSNHRPLPIAMSVNALGSYMRTSPRAVRLDQTIAKQAHTSMAEKEEGSLAFGLIEEVNKLEIKDLAQLDALLEENEELVLYTATHWNLGKIHHGQCIVQLVHVLQARRRHREREDSIVGLTQGIIEAYEAAKKKA
jgi:hypothetical protein